MAVQEGGSDDKKCVSRTSRRVERPCRIVRNYTVLGAMKNPDCCESHPEDLAAASLEGLSLSDGDRDTHEASKCKCAYSAEDNSSEPEDQPPDEEFIRQALNQQTNLLYEQYAREQHPEDPEKQKELVHEMQEQYFAHYMSEVHHFQLVHQQQQLEQWHHLSKTRAESDKAAASNNETQSEIEKMELPPPLPLIPAAVWTRKDINEFKQEILKTQRECCVKIGSLATATIRVPTHPEGSSIFWEFATDYYDLGFGLYFEWDLEPQENITVNISESSDDEGEDVEEENSTPGSESSTGQNDLERGRRRTESRVPTDELIPIYRRDCHTEVYCGSHQYPGVGVYVFKFDNSFSLWRSKWLYYRIYYSQ
ncbi:unnamed protein product [Calicophoron daubneyi]|uniref:GOLD domain-containing protein n=1 Tax=Calicophoron daubneyi TaxID=300641 RepID=A0AAV2TV07_CALDB